MSGTTITVDGLDDLRKALRQFADGANDLKATHADAAKLVESTASMLVPRRSGTLAGSIRSSGTQRSGVVRSGGARVPYAGPIHFGWRARNIRPNPFLYGALDQRRDDVIARYERTMSDLIRKYQL